MWETGSQSLGPGGVSPMGPRGTVGTRGACRERVLGWGPMWEQVREISGAHGRVRVRKTLSGHSQNVHLVTEQKKTWSP